MRRFWAHIIFVCTAIVMMAVSFSAVFTKTQTNLEYTEGREITFRLTEKDDSNGEEEIEDPDAAKNMAETMKKRLETAGVTEYNVKSYGNDIVKVQFAEPDSNQQRNVIGYLGFNGSLALTNMDDDENYTTITQAEDHFLLKDHPAYLDTVNNYPSVVIPIDKNNEEFKVLVDNTKKQKEAGKGETTETGETNSETGEAETTTTTYIYLWYDFDIATDRYSRTVDGNEDYDVNIARKIIMKFNIENLYYPDDKEDKLAATINLDSDGNGSLSTTEVRNGFDNARFYVNLLNAGTLDYKVTQINNEKVLFVPATTESLIQNSDPHQYLAWSRTFIATLCAIAIVSLLLAVFFKLSTLSIATSSLASIFASIGFMVLLNAEFNIAALVAIIAVSFASLASGILYASRLKEESYKGRTLKKANTEAAKKALLPTLDIHLGLVFLGAFVYLLGGSLMRSFALISVVGGIASLVVNLVILRGLMWLVTNNTAFAGKYNYFGIEQDKVPSLADEVKQEPYKGAYESKDLTKHRKPLGIAILALFVASVAGLITFGVIDKNQPFAQASEPESSQVYVYSSNELATVDTLSSELFEKITIYKDLEDTEGKTLLSYVDTSNYYAHTETVEGVEKTTYYFEYTLKSALKGNALASATFYEDGAKNDLETILSAYHSLDAKSNAYVKVSGAYIETQANFGGIIAGTAIAIGVMGLYFMIRYRLTRGLVALAAPIVTTAIGVGIFSLMHFMTLPSKTAVIIPLVALFTMIISIFFMNKERELIVEDKERVITLGHREELMKKANSIAFEPILIFAIVACYIGINFFGFGPNATSLIFIAITIAVILASIVVVNQFGPSAHYLYTKFHRIEEADLSKRTKKKKNNKIQSATHRSSEPEEAIFIGIND